ncbi:hypothetical protein HR12_42115 [Microbacterium sp. SUBG005]|nr:hypothetical protein HR12_42115 [Microbacterium sp. SUBG005]
MCAFGSRAIHTSRHAGGMTRPRARSASRSGTAAPVWSTETGTPTPSAPGGSGVLVGPDADQSRHARQCERSMSISSAFFLPE